jgi:hypothetical protein
MPKLEIGYRRNFATLERASAAGDLALIDCQDKATGQPVRVIAAMQREADGDITIVPLARMFDGNPYDELNPPNPDGGYVQTGS